MSEDIVRTGAWLRKRAVPIGICVLLVGAGLYTLFQYGSRLVGAGPYLFLLACPLMHLFMHRGHGSHGGHGSSRDHSGHGNNARQLSVSQPDSVESKESHHH